MKKKLPAGQVFWKKAKKIIPGGNMLLSKSHSYFYLINGQHILKNKKDVKFGVLITMNI